MESPESLNDRLKELTYRSRRTYSKLTDVETRARRLDERTDETMSVVRRIGQATSAVDAVLRLDPRVAGFVLGAVKAFVVGAVQRAIAAAGATGIAAATEDDGWRPEDDGEGVRRADGCRTPTVEDELIGGQLSDGWDFGAHHFAIK